jgi:hypothetical protein
LFSRCWGLWRHRVEEGAAVTRKERLACMHWYHVRLFAVLRVFMGHVAHRRMKCNHYALLHTRVCAAALLPLAFKRLAKHCQVCHHTHLCTLSHLASAATIITHISLQARQVKRRKLAAAAHCARGQLFNRMLKRWSRGARQVIMAVLDVIKMAVAGVELENS